MQRGCIYMDLPVFFILLILNIVDRSLQKHHHDRWEQVSIRYGEWHVLPRYQSNAFDEGYTRLNDVCKTDNYHGFLFAKQGIKAMPIYDLNGNLAGIQSTIPGNMRGYNSQNETVDLPPVEIMPPVLKGMRDERGILYYTVTAYFKHPKLICSPIAPKGVSPGRGLYIQMGFNPVNDYLHIPKEAHKLSPLWVKGNCMYEMGTHYFMNMSRQLPCEKIYPVFLMYDPDGHLGAFGWVFQGRPNNYYSVDRRGWFNLTPKIYSFLYDTNKLPACMFNENFRVFGIHIYLKDQTEMLCPPHSLNYTYKVTAKPPRTQTTQNSITVIESDTNSRSKNYEIDAFNKSSSATELFSFKNNVLLLTLLLLSVLFLTRYNSH